MRPRESKMTSEWTSSSGSGSAGPFVALFLRPSCAFQPAGSSTLFFFQTLLQSALFFSKKGNWLFVALCVGMQGRKEEGKTIVSMATWLKKRRKRKNTQSPYNSFLVWGHHDGWAVVGVSSIDIFPLLTLCVCLTFFFFWEQICRLVSVNFARWLFRSRAAAVSVNQSMGPEGKDKERKSWHRRRSGEKRKWDVLTQDMSGDEGGIFPPPLSRKLLCSLSFLPKASQSSADALTDILCLLCSLFIVLKWLTTEALYLSSVKCSNDI